MVPSPQSKSILLFWLTAIRIALTFHKVLGHIEPVPRKIKKGKLSSLFIFFKIDVQVFKIF